VTDPLRHIVLYGSLRQGEKGFIELGLEGRIHFVDRCRFGGFLFDLGEYPGVKCDAEAPDVAGDLYEIDDPTVVADMDRFERYNAADASPLDRMKGTGSLYIRKPIEVTTAHGGKMRAYIYEYNDELVLGASRSRLFIAGGDWRSYRASRGG